METKIVDSAVFDVVIIGGSYAGLSAAMALGRALRNVLIIDGGKPCNRQTPHAHNFLTQDGSRPAEIAILAREQVEAYPTVHFRNGLVVKAVKQADGLFYLMTDGGQAFYADKLILATGVIDIMPAISGFSACWGISILHCPYCHGYEVRNLTTGVLANGDMGFEYIRMISNWTQDLTLYTNGKAELSEGQREKLAFHQIQVIESEIDRVEHKDGQIDFLVFKDQTKIKLEALYARLPTVQSSEIVGHLGCELNEAGFIKVDFFQKTSVQGLFACGDTTTPFRSVAAAVASGNVAGAMANKEIIEERF